MAISSSRYDAEIASPEMSFSGWARWTWRQLTSMRTALILLLLLAIAAVPGSVYPQRSADPNGVTQYFDNYPDVAPVLDAIQLFDVYTSVWFSAIYILLFISLIGCVVPRTGVHWEALRSTPPPAPRLFSRMPAHLTVQSTSKAADAKKTNFAELGEKLLRKQGYRVVRNGKAVSAERGYLRETGNLVFHFSLIGVLAAVGIGGGTSFSGQRVLVEGETFVNNLASYDSLSPGTFFNENMLQPFSVSLDKFEVDFDLQNRTNVGTPLDFRAFVSTRQSPNDAPEKSVIRVNQPLELPGANLYLTGNGYAPHITIRDAEGNITFAGANPFLPQDSTYTSLGVVKVPDVERQFGIIAFFYPTVDTLTTGALTSIYPAPVDPLLTLNVYEGDLGLDNGVPQNVYALDTSSMKQVAGGKSGVKGLRLQLGETADLPGGLGSVTFDSIKRFASLDVAYNPGGLWVLIFALLSLAGVTTSLLVPRRRVWVRNTDEGFEVAALARGDDPALEKIVAEVAAELKQAAAPQKTRKK